MRDAAEASLKSPLETADLTSGGRMTLSGTSSATAGNVTADQLGVAVARKSLDQQRLEGEAAVGLIQQAAAVTQPAATGKGRLVDVVA
jgi:hypothetical protein